MRGLPEGLLLRLAGDSEGLLFRDGDSEPLDANGLLARPLALEGEEYLGGPLWLPEGDREGGKRGGPAPRIGLLERDRLDGAADVKEPSGLGTAPKKLPLELMLTLWLSQLAGCACSCPKERCLPEGDIDRPATGTSTEPGGEMLMLPPDCQD